MKNTWDHDLMEILEQARGGKTKTLKKYLKEYAPFVAVNKETTVLLTLRQFYVTVLKGGKRNVLNCAPEGKHFQWGITITTDDDDASTETNIYLPNGNHYTGLEIKGNVVQILMKGKPGVNTTVGELLGRMKFWSDFTEKELDAAFEKLGNGEYTEKALTKPVVASKTVTLETAGKLTYKEKYGWYEGKMKSDVTFKVNINWAEPAPLKKVILFADKQLKKKFYEEMLLKMETKMIKLKNDGWLDEDEDTGEEEKPVTAKEFRERISVSSIVFYDDCSSVIYCDDDDLFVGHTIEIDVDKNGKYKGARLVG